MKILVTGPESTGKTTLCTELSAALGLPLVLEYAREYLADIRRPYTYDDVAAIAHQQAEMYQAFDKDAGFIMDTYLIVIKIWMEEKYGEVPAWIDERIQEDAFDHVFLMTPDIPWQADPLRESPLDRDRLLQRYREELDRFGIPYHMISGLGDLRMSAVLRILRGD